MKKWMQRIFFPDAKTKPTIEAAVPASPGSSASTKGLSSTTAPDPLNALSQIRALQMELDARNQHIAHLTAEIERLKERQETIVEETVQSRIEALLGDLSGSASQVLTQSDLLESQGKPVQARDVLAVARRMVRVLERHGMTIEGQVGGQAAFDPNRHTLMNSDAAILPGAPVTIRFVAVSYRGKILHKALVE